MRVLCPPDAVFWEPAPESTTLSGIPLTFYRDLIDNILEVEVAPLLQDNRCDSSAPCTVLRKAMQICIAHLSVCKQWKAFVSTVLARPRYALLKTRATGYSFPFSERTASAVATRCSLNGRYRGFNIIEEGYGKSVLHAYDYGGPGGCHGKVEVVIKISNSRREFENEHDAYVWLAEQKTSPSDVPQLYYAGNYGSGSTFYGLVMSKLGPDLDVLRGRCRHQRFTPKMTLAVAIQTIGIYERLHSRGWLHCNAKPGNFAIGPDIPGQKCRIFMFDFEFSRLSEPAPQIQGTPHSGWNTSFRAMNLYLGLTPTRRDDLEGLGYVFSYLERGAHPWKNCPSMDPAYSSYFNDVKALAWGERPDYNKLVQLFVEAWKRKGYCDSPWEIDWRRELNGGEM